MQRFGLVLLGCLLVSDLFAQSSADSPRQTARLVQRVTQRQSEVQHLQDDLSRQESASQQAAQRLQQQDRTIAQLREQLKLAHSGARAPAVSH